MISLRAQNSQLTKNAKYSFLNTNYLSGVDEVVLTNSLGFAADDYVLLGEWGSETSEIMQIDTVTAATHTLKFTADTKFAHSESTKVYRIRYNQVLFYHTAAATFSNTENPLPTGAAAAQDLQADSIFTTLEDTVNTTGYGWFVFYKSTAPTKVTENSNAIPYANFSESTTKKILDNFYSLLNDKERRQIDIDDAFSWMNEAISVMTGELNLISSSYMVSDDTTVSVVSGTSEYSLESDFSDIVSVYDSTNDREITSIDIADTVAWGSNSSNSIRYYLRGNKIGFSPEPSEAFTCYVKYKSLGAIYDTYDDVADLPDKAWHTLKYYIMFLACIKLNRTDGENFLKLFDVGVQRMKMISHKRSNNNDNWIPDRASMI